VTRLSKTENAVVYSGEIWTDARGLATVALPRAARVLSTDLKYELRPFTRGVSASIAAELVDGRFTIETDEPHVKVAWQIKRGRREHQRKEER